MNTGSQKTVEGAAGQVAAVIRERVTDQTDLLIDCLSRIAATRLDAVTERRVIDELNDLAADLHNNRLVPISSVLTRLNETLARFERRIGGYEA